MLNLSKNPIFYVARDIERALGISIATPGYFIISNNSPFAKLIAKNHSNILLINSPQSLDTIDLLSHNKVKKFITTNSNHSQPKILVFKNTTPIEKICNKNNWQLLNPSAVLAKRVEEKISQITWLENLTRFLPPHQITTCAKITWNNQPFILQFNHAHTGTGTILVQTKKELLNIQKTFPNREARISQYIQGSMFTNNNIVTNTKILSGNINLQITGLPPFTDLPFSTIGNDWGFAAKFLTAKQKKDYLVIVKAIGKKLQKQGWRGLFGIDVLIEAKTGKAYLIEINARQPASTTYESQLQGIRNTKSTKLRNYELTTFEAHLRALSDEDLANCELIKIKDGAQIIQRVTKKIPSLNAPQYHHGQPFKIISYPTTQPNSDLWRIQTPYSLMDTPTQLNKNGKEIIDLILITAAHKAWNTPRGGGVIIKDKKILLLKRHKYGFDYYVLPGGTQEQGEKIIDTARREIWEETGLTCELENNPWQIKSKDRTEYYFPTKKIIGTAKLGGEEKKMNNPDNHYELVWIKLRELKKINLLPEVMKEKIMKMHD